MNQFDPKMQVTVIDLSEGVPPEILYFNFGPKKELLSFEPNFDLGAPSYQVPRDYAERLLENAGGRTFKLFSPNNLVIRKSNGRGGIQYVTLNAVKKDESGAWVEKTDEEIKAEGSPAVSPTMVKIMAAATKPEEIKAPEPVVEEKPIRGRKK
jgi:hypothetical protein